MEEILAQKAQSYAEKHHLQLREQLGFGIHGNVIVAENKWYPGDTALKVHRYDEPFRREVAVYGRLSDARVQIVRGFNVPQFVRADTGLLVLEMTIVARPFVLDFAGAYLDFPPQFTEEVWHQWESDRREQFEDRWAQVQAVLSALEELDIYLLDVSPSNVAFADP